MDKKVIIGIAILVIAITAVAVFIWIKGRDGAIDSNATMQNSNEQRYSRVEAIQKEIAAGTAVLVDVREPDEFAAGHAENAKLIPLGDIQAGKFNEDKEKTIYVYCRSGRRAEEARTTLQNNGYERVENLGGLVDWEMLGGRVVK